MYSIKNKVALITGGAGGIGVEMVKSLLKNGAKKVAVIDKSENAGKRAVSEIETLFGDNKVFFIKSDVTVKKDLEDAFDTVIKNTNQLDIVINNAGIMNEINWKQTLNLNLTAVIEGTYLAMKNYLPRYKSGEEGVIVNTASVLGLTTMQVTPVYCATKHGLIGFGKAVGGPEFYRNYKVRVLTLCPGLVKTPLTITTEDILFPEIEAAEIENVQCVFQSPERVGEALIEVLKNGRNGSLWVTENEKPVYEVVVPHRNTMKVNM